MADDGSWGQYAWDETPNEIGASPRRGQRSRRADLNSSGLPLVWFGDLKPNLDSADFVEELLTKGGMSVIYGESNCGKTFFMTDLGLHVAMGKAWQGRDVEAGGVIYCALEGSHGIANRVAAFRKHHSLEGTELPFAVIPVSLNMLDPDADTDRLIAAIKEAAQRVNLPISLIVIDTLSRALAGGNENGSEDMGALVKNTDRVREATRAHVSYVHHCGKDAAKGARGHSLLRAATDTEIEVSRANKDTPSVAVVTKQREMEINGRFAFNLMSIDFGLNRRGKPVTSCVVVPVDQPAEAEGRRKPLGKNSQIAVDMLRRALADIGQLLPATPDYPANTYAVMAEQWRQTFYVGVPDENMETKRKAFKRAKDDLLASRIVASLNDLVWFVRRADQ